MVSPGCAMAFPLVCGMPVVAAFAKGLGFAPGDAAAKGLCCCAPWANGLDGAGFAAAAQGFAFAAAANGLPVGVAGLGFVVPIEAATGLAGVKASVGVLSARATGAVFGVLVPLGCVG